MYASNFTYNALWTEHTDDRMSAQIKQSQNLSILGCKTYAVDNRCQQLITKPFANKVTLFISSKACFERVLVPIHIKNRT